MCRLTAYLGKPILAADLVTRPSRSVIRQSFDARERAGGSGPNVYEIGALNADGFGLGWYTDPTGDNDDANEDVAPCVYTEVGPAWNNRNLNRLARKISSNCIFAHVRAAGPGMGVCECSCHPFQSGRYLFMHNGSIGGFDTIRRPVLASLKDWSFNYAIGNSCSDTALAFAVFLDQLDKPDQQVSGSRLKEMMAKTVQILCNVLDKEGIEETSLLNFVVTDGTCMVATRYSHSVTGKINSCSLYFAAGSKFEVDGLHTDRTPAAAAAAAVAAGSGGGGGGGKGPAHQHGPGSHIEAVQEYRMSHSSGHTGVVIITSEPLTNARADWVPVPENHIIIATADRQVLLSPLPSRQFECLGAAAAMRESTDALEMLGHDTVCQRRRLHAARPHDHHHHRGRASGNAGLDIATNSPPPTSFAGHSPSCAAHHHDEGAGGASGHHHHHHGSTGSTHGHAFMHSSRGGREAPAKEVVDETKVRASDFVLSLSVEGAGAKVTGGGIGVGSILGAAGGSAAAAAATAEGGGSKTKPDAVAGQPPATAAGCASRRERALSAIVVSQKLNLIITADAHAQGRIYIWDVTMWSLLPVAKDFDSCVMCLCMDDEHSLLYSSCSDNVVYVHDISQVKTRGVMPCMLSFSVPNIGHMLSLSVMYLNFGVTLLLLGSQDGNVRRICLNSSLCLSGQADSAFSGGASGPGSGSDGGGGGAGGGKPRARRPVAARGRGAQGVRRGGVAAAA